MEAEIAPKLLEYGLLGAITLGSLWVAAKMYKRGDSIREETQQRLEEKDKEHAAEMQALQERYITKSESWMQQYHEQARAQTEVLQSMERRYKR